MTEVTMERMWFNQPSTLQPQHERHGTNVLVDLDDKGGPRAYFLSGPIISMDVMLEWLSKGWRTHDLQRQKEQPVKRIMLAAGPWMTCGRNMARRIVLYEFGPGKLVVHNQTFENDFHQTISFTTGDYFPVTEYVAAVACWTKRNQENMGSEVLPATPAFAAQANAADLLQQYKL